MHMLVKLIFITAAYMHNIARASDGCGKPELPENTVPLTDYSQKINANIRFQCVKGYVRKAGTSSLIRCREQNGKMAWHTELPLKCIPDPKIPTVATTVAETQTPHKQSTLCTTEKTAKNHPTLQGTSSPTTETGHIALTTTLEVVTTKTRRTTSQPTLMSTTKETESITTTNETTTSYTSREYMTTASSHALSGSFTTTTGLNTSVRTSNISEESNTAAFSNGFTPTVGGVTILICLLVAAVAVLIFWLRKRNTRSQRENQYKTDLQISYSPVCELNSAQLNKTSENSTEGSVIDNNSSIPNSVDTCDELLKTKFIS